MPWKVISQMDLKIKQIATLPTGSRNDEEVITTQSAEVA